MVQKVDYFEQIFSPGATTCNSCPVGHSCPNKDQNPVICPMGSFSDGGQEACQVFGVHFYDIFSKMLPLLVFSVIIIGLYILQIRNNLKKLMIKNYNTSYFRLWSNKRELFNIVVTSMFRYCSYYNIFDILTTFTTPPPCPDLQCRLLHSSSWSWVLSGMSRGTDLSGQESAAPGLWGGTLQWSRPGRMSCLSHRYLE